ncbi:CDK5 regulatory subunit-associated protein [Gracilaria domingensis]|nr:CDK5 regulatory subunit-associated protein [Gracilaria domingensis]
MGVIDASPSNQPTAPADAPDASSEQTEAAATLADATFREQYVNELMELRAFLNQRRAEMTRIDNTDVALALQQQQNDAKNSVQMDVHTVNDMYRTVDDVIDAIHGDETRKMVALWSNDNLLARTARGVLEAKMGAQRASGAIDVCRRQRAAAAVQLKEETRQLDQLGEQTRAIKSEVEAALSQLYGGRDVNIVGEINVLFAAKRSS